MNLPTWLYSQNGKSVIVKTENELNDYLNRGWKDSPDRFKEEVKELPKPQTNNQYQSKRK